MFATQKLRHSGHVQQFAAAGRPADDVQSPLGPLDSDGLAAELHRARLPAAVGGVGKSHRSVVRHARRLHGPQPGRHRRSLLARHVHLVPKRDEQRRRRKTRPSSRSAATGWATTSASFDIDEPGWWTLGMSFTSDGQVHYYASEGVDDLTAEDHIMSSFPYGMKCITFNNFFFNVANWDNGPHVVDAVGDRRPEDFRDPAAGPDGRAACTASRRSRSKAEAAAADGAARSSRCNSRDSRSAFGIGFAAATSQR